MSTMLVYWSDDTALQSFLGDNEFSQAEATVPLLLCDSPSPNDFTGSFACNVYKETLAHFIYCDASLIIDRYGTRYH